MKMKRILLIMILAMCMVLVGSVNAEILLNPGFEDDFNDPCLPDSWTLDALGYYGGTMWITYVEDDPFGANSGDDYIAMGYDGGANNWGGYAMAIQEIAASPGVEYVISANVAYVGVPGGNTIVELKLRYLNSSGAKISEDKLPQSFLFDGNYHLISDSGIAPPLTASIRASYVFKGYQDVVPQEVHFDDVSIVPEPATLALLGLGTILLRKKRHLV